MDKVVDHLLVFKGDGVINDFPGNYTQYRAFRDEWKAVGGESIAKGDGKPKKESADRSLTSHHSPLNSKRKLTYKEKREFEQLEKEIAALEAEQHALEEALCSGTLSVEELTEKSKRLPQLKDELDEKSLRWLELSEIEG